MEQVEKVGYLPMRRSLANDPSLNTPQLAYIKELVTFMDEHPLKFNWPENVAALQDSLGHAIANVMAGKQAPEAALREAESNYNRMR
jgi:ABC-type glycerol-3-phosphate transport system substrate-binding protein